MTIETLIITMNQKDISKYNLMHVEGDAIISNQTNHNEILIKEKNGNRIKFISTDTLGVGRNRNQAILLADADILIFADDDTIFSEGYSNQILNDFKNRDVDMMIYSMIFTKEGKEVKRKINKNSRVRKWNCLKHGGASLVVRRESLVKKNIWFSLEFGGGTNHGSGEDSIFIMDALKKKLKIFSSDYILGVCSQDSSTWFEGYNKKFFVDKGILYKVLFPKLFPLIIGQYLIRHSYMYKKKYSFFYIYKIMITAAQKYS